MKRGRNKTVSADTTKDAARLAVSLRRAQIRVQAMASAAEAAASLLDIGEAAEARLIARKPSSRIAALLGYANEAEMIHRTNLVLV